MVAHGVSAADLGSLRCCRFSVAAPRVLRVGVGLAAALEGGREKRGGGHNRIDEECIGCAASCHYAFQLTRESSSGVAEEWQAGAGGREQAGRQAEKRREIAGRCSGNK